MPYTPTKYPNGTFSWADVASTDIAKTKAFMEGLLGWTSEDMPTGKDTPDYTMFRLDGKNVAGGSPTFMPNMPSFWSSYISVDNVDEVVSNVEKLGGKITMSPMDVLDSGRMATIQDPTGANVGLWQPKKHIGASIINTAGAMCWNELYTNDIVKAKEFYTKLFGWTYDDGKTGYVTIMNNGRPNGGMMEIQPEWGNMPPNWTVYFTVKNLDDALAKVKELGGTSDMGPKEVGVGKIAMVADPTQAHFMLMEMSVPPTEWVDQK